MNEILQKKYISLVQELPDDIVKNATPKIQQFIIDRKIERIMGAASLSELSLTDIEILKLPQNDEIRKRKKEDFSVGFMTTSTYLVFDIENNTNSNTAKYGLLYGFDEIINGLPNILDSLSISNKSDKSIKINIPESINNLTKLNVLSLRNVINKIPDNINRLNLKFLDLQNNPELEDIPNNLLESCSMVVLTGCDKLLNSNTFITKMKDLNFTQMAGIFKRNKYEQ